MQCHCKFILIITILLLFSCKKEKKNNDITDSLNNKSIVELNFTNDYLIDTITYNNLIKSIYYIPLETTSKSMLGRGDIIVRKVAGNYIVSTGEYQC